MPREMKMIRVGTPKRYMTFEVKTARNRMIPARRMVHSSVTPIYLTVSS